MGCLWASRLALTFNHVAVIQRSVAKEQLQLTYRDESAIDPKITLACSQSIAQYPAEQIQNVSNLLVCVKSYQLEQALKSVSHAVTKNTRVLLLQNGMGNRETALSTLPNCQLFMATTTQGAYIESRNTNGSEITVVHAGRGITAIGPANNEQSINSAPTHCHALQLALPDVYWHYNIEQLLWKKLAINAAINPLTAHYQCRNGELLDNADRQRHLLRLIGEMKPVLVQCCPYLEQLDLESEVLQVAKATGNNYSSMYQDLASGRATEIEAITGYLLTRANELQAELPSHLELYQSLTNH